MYEQDGDDGSDRAFLKEGKDLSGKNSVRRPPVQPFDPQKDDFVFMQIDTDYYTEVPPSFISSAGVETCIVRMFGITAQSNSVSLHIHNFTPYFYVKINQQRMPALGPEDLTAIRE